MFKRPNSEWKEIVTNSDKLPESIKYSHQYLFAFSEQRVAMLNSILKSKKAVETNIAIMCAFVEIKKNN